MSYSNDQLLQVFKRTSGKCHICHRRLVFKNYGKRGSRGAWHVEHSKPRARGGTDHGNNLMPAHIRCNLDKGTASTASARARHGKRRKPMSIEQRDAARANNTIAGGAIGTAVGGAMGGPPGAAVGLFVGTLLGSAHEPEDI